jgi:hypothetical protein
MQSQGLGEVGLSMGGEVSRGFLWFDPKMQSVCFKFSCAGRYPRTKFLWRQLPRKPRRNPGKELPFRLKAEGSLPGRGAWHYSTCNKQQVQASDINFLQVQFRCKSSHPPAFPLLHRLGNPADRGGTTGEP